MPELEDDVAPDDVTATDADESANQEILTDAALVRAATERYENKDADEPGGEVAGEVGGDDDPGGQDPVDP